MGLWEDISRLDRQAIELTLDELLGKPAKKKNARPAARQKKQGLQPTDDRPATIIVHQLSVLAGFTDQVAKEKLTAALMARGLTRQQLPPQDAIALRPWIDKLIEHVSSALVSAEAAKLILRK
jgi:hypothetical protein